MKLSDFANLILFEATLEAKLTSVTSFEDEDALPLAAAPEAPARPSNLAFQPRGSQLRAPFPSLHDLERDDQRGVVLHFFANHELLAMELMALAILRFPQAPSAFRRGIAQTILEEQEHLRLYIGRMQELGVTFGSIPVNRFFWDAIAPMATPMDYVTRMSMTLEQANLDFSLHYRDVFARLGDQKTAAILDRVYREEIGHVKHGVVWFERWRDPTKSQWQDYLARMAPPLAASRAKGTGYDRSGRELAGLSAEFIDELSVYKHSKGRPPVVYTFNPACEEEIMNGLASFTPGKALNDIERDLASLMMFVARDADVVLCEVRPSTKFLAGIQRLGFDIPQMADKAAERELQRRLIHHVESWGQSPRAAARIARLGLNASHQREPLTDYAVFSKAWSLSLARELAADPIVGKTASSMDAVEAFLAAHPGRTIVIKAAFGASGRNMQRILPSGMTVNQRRWLEKEFAGSGQVIVEEWLDRVLDFSVQLAVNTGEKPVLGVTRFLTDERGQYIGHRLGKKFADLPAPWLRTIGEERFQETLTAIGHRVVERLAAAGYAGAAGIDSLVYRDAAGQLRLKPIVEINPRHTMGRIALEIDRRVHHTVPALWLHLSAKQAIAAGAKDFDDFVGQWADKFPLELRDGLIIEGVVPTNDPALARSVLTVLFTGKAAAAASQFMVDQSAKNQI